MVFDAATDSLVQVGSAASIRSTRTATSSCRGSASIWDPFDDGLTSVRAAYAIMVDQPVTNVVTPTAANPPLATPLTFAGPIRLDNAADARAPPGWRRIR